MLPVFDVSHSNTQIITDKDNCKTTGFILIFNLIFARDTFVLTKLQLKTHHNFFLDFSHIMEFHHFPQGSIC